MITYDIDTSSKTKITKQYQVWFSSNHILNFDDYIKKWELQTTIRKLDIKYYISHNIYESLRQSLISLEADSIMRPQAEWCFSDLISLEYISLSHISIVEIPSFEYVFWPWDYSDTGFLKHIGTTFSHLTKLADKDDSIQAHKTVSSNHRYIREYIVFLFLVKNEKLFRCIEPISMNIDIVDSWNLHHHIKDSAHIIFPVDEYLFRWIGKEHIGNEKYLFKEKIQRTEGILEALHHNKQALNNNEKATPEYKKTIEQATTKFGRDIAEIKSEYVYMGEQAVIDIWTMWLADNRTHKIEIQSKKSHWLVKPTIKKENVDEIIKLNTDRFGSREIKRHTVWNYTVKHTEYSPTYIIYKKDNESI